MCILLYFTQVFLFTSISCLSLVSSDIALSNGRDKSVKIYLTFTSPWATRKRSAHPNARGGIAASMHFCEQVSSYVDTGHCMIPISRRSVKTTKMQYRNSISSPSVLFIFHLQAAILDITKRRIIARRRMEQNKPLDSTLTDAPSVIADFISHGNGSLN